MATSPSCTAETLIDTLPGTKCLACLSQSELLMVLLYILMYYFDEEADIDGALADSACHDCLSDKQKLQGIVAVLAYNVLDEEVSTDDIREIVKCIKCVEPGKLKAAITYYLCRYITAVSGPQ